jgi:hypothetical protein
MMPFSLINWLQQFDLTGRMPDQSGAALTITDSVLTFHSSR